ncbi:MAG: hypothetical protein JSU63_03620 [Phycisphaerales bacterium]|nr:MAG: hypothetical protein JSU63_03620 [Phycisphaerales bacterium]
MSKELRSFVSRIPGIGDVPVSGALFSTVSYRKSRGALMILAAPESATPINVRGLLHLTEGDVRPPRDSEPYALGLIDGYHLGNQLGVDGASRAHTRTRGPLMVPASMCNRRIRDNAGATWIALEEAAAKRLGKVE